MKREETGGLLKQSKKKKGRNRIEVELLECGDRQEYFIVIKKTEELKMIPRCTAWESLYTSKDFHIKY